MSNPGKTFFTTASRAGRRIAAASSRMFSAVAPNAEIAKWNAEVDARKAQRKAENKAKRAVGRNA